MCVVVFFVVVVVLFRFFLNSLRMKGWSSGKKPAVQKNNKILDLEGIFKTSSFDWSNLTAL